MHKLSRSPKPNKKEQKLNKDELDKTVCILVAFILDDVF